MKPTSFYFQGRHYSLPDLLRAKVRKNYWIHSHSERCLVEDDNGNLFHYMFEEDMRFDGRPDRQDHLWVLVRDEADSNQLATMDRMELLRPPYIAADETGWVAVYDSHNQEAKQYGYSKSDLPAFLDALRRLFGVE